MTRDRQPTEPASRTVVAMVVVMFAFIALYGSATAVFVILYGGTAAVISLSLLAVLIGVAALVFSRLLRRH